MNSNISVNNKKRFDKLFFKKMLIIAIPIILEQLLVSSFGVVDTVMVKSIYRGVSGVGLASQISTVCGTIMFGFSTGVGMYIAQYFGDNDKENIKNSFSLLIILGFILSSIFLIICLICPRQILSIFSKDDEVLDIATQYIRIASLSYIPNQLSYAFVVAYRNIQKPIVSVIIQMSSSVINVILNWLLIYGIWIFPCLGIKGAAIATVISCMSCLVAHIIYVYATKQMFRPNFNSFKKAFDITFSGRILKRSLPLIINETLFSIGTLIYVAIFNRLGSDQYEGYRISETIMNVLFSVSYGANAATQAMIGECLGRNDFDQAKQYSRNFLYTGIGLSIIIAGLTIIFSNPLVNIFASDEVSLETLRIARLMMFSVAVRIALKLYANIILSIFRAGGLTRFVMILDCLVMWLVGIPIAIIGYHVLHIDNVANLYLLMQLEAVVRITIGMIEYFRYRWVNNIIKVKK